MHVLLCIYNYKLLCITKLLTPSLGPATEERGGRGVCYSREIERPYHQGGYGRWVGWYVLVLAA